MMKKGNQFALLCFITILAAACSDNNKPSTGHDQHVHGTQTSASAGKTSTGAIALTSTTITLKDPNLDAVYQQYQVLTKALVVEDVNTAKTAALAIETGAREIKGAAAMARAAAEISSTSDVKAQRLAFASLNEDLIKLLKDIGLDQGKLYVAHCPMALNDQGASWVSTTKEIRNPYFGDSMLTCGSVTETL
jgi:hypothetical protein